MKSILLSLLFAWTAAAQPTLKVGSDVNLAPLAAADWLQGSAPASFEPGKVYLFECWATWCGPCVAAIPHVNELHRKFHDKGLRVFGMNVLEDDLDKVRKFVKAKGEGMSYPVAYTGKGSAFETQWLKAAGVPGIPHVFIVKDGKLALMSHPQDLTDAVIEAVLSGDDWAKNAAVEIDRLKAAKDKSMAVLAEFRKATAAHDPETMELKLAEFRKLDPDSIYQSTMELDLMLVRKDWPAANRMIGEMPEGPNRRMALGIISNKIGADEEASYPVELINTLIRNFSEYLDQPGASVDPMEFITLSKLQWKSGDKDSALTSAEKAADLVRGRATARSMPATPFERFARSIENGTMPTAPEMSEWIREAMAKNTNPAK